MTSFECVLITGIHEEVQHGRKVELNVLIYWSLFTYSKICFRLQDTLLAHFVVLQCRYTNNDVVFPLHIIFRVPKRNLSGLCTTDSNRSYLVTGSHYAEVVYTEQTLLKLER